MRNVALIVAAAAVVAISAFVRLRQAGPHVETVPTAPLEPNVEAEPSPDRTPARPAEVAAALSRVFGDAMPPERTRPEWAVVGDFNGDGASDLAVPVRIPPARAAALGAELANWIRQDPSAPLPATDPSAGQPAVTFAPDDAALVVIHGVGPSGWRDPEARQAYLLTFSAPGKLDFETRQSLAARARAVGQHPLELRGDVVYEPGGARFLYWTGARYAWHAAVAR